MCVKSISHKSGYNVLVQHNTCAVNQPLSQILREGTMITNALRGLWSTRRRSTLRLHLSKTQTAKTNRIWQEPRACAQKRYSDKYRTLLSLNKTKLMRCLESCLRSQSLPSGNLCHDSEKYGKSTLQTKMTDMRNYSLWKIFHFDLS